MKGGAGRAAALKALARQVDGDVAGARDTARVQVAISEMAFPDEPTARAVVLGASAESEPSRAISSR